MQCDDMGMYYTFKDGYCSASCIYDRYTTDEQPGLSRVCLGGTYPSKHLDEYFERMHPNAVRLLKEIGIQNGVLMLSGFHYAIGNFLRVIGLKSFAVFHNCAPLHICSALPGPIAFHFTNGDFFSKMAGSFFARSTFLPFNN